MKKNLYIMYAMALLQGMVFYSPIATLYRQAQGVTIFQITVIESISLALGILLEIPWGIVADKIGYRKTMVFCSELYFVSKIIFWKATGFGGFLADNGGVKRLPGMYVAMTILLALMAPSFAWPWATVAIIALVCVALAGYGASTQLMFLNIAEKEYPQALDLASSLNSIFANIGISLGSLTAAETVAQAEPA